MITEPAYLLWYDDHPKRDLVTKIDQAIEAYLDRFRITPNVVLIAGDDPATLPVLPTHPEVRVRGSEFVRRNHFWLGRENDEGALQPLEVPMLNQLHPQLASAVAAKASSVPTTRSRRSKRVAEAIS